MPTIEDIARDYCDPRVVGPYSAGRRHPATLVSRKLLIARGPSQEFELFVEGSLASFGQLPSGAGVSWGQYHEPSGAPLDALCLSLPNAPGACRLLAHVAYEAYQLLAPNPGLPNPRVMQVLWPYIGLILARGLLSEEEQQGLLGELLLLERLLDLAKSAGLSESSAIDSWKGWDRAASRDFSRNGIVVEVKTTAAPTRQHTISSLEQLELSTGEAQLFLYSISLKPDPSGGIRLVDQVDRLVARLTTTQAAFVDYLRKARFEVALAQQYRLATPFITTRFVTAMFSVDNGLSRLRLSSLVGSTLPANVTRVSYVLDLQAAALSTNLLAPAAGDAQLLAMLR